MTVCLIKSYDNSCVNIFILHHCVFVFYIGDLSKRWSGLKETDVSYVRCITNYWYDIDNKLLSLLLDNAYNTKHVHHKLFVKLVAQSDRRYLVRYENWIDIEADDWYA